MYCFLIKIRSSLLVFLTHHMALPFLKIIRKPAVFPYTLNALSNMQNGTLGYDLYLFLNKNNLNLLPYYAKHDVKHILLGYNTTEDGEVCLQCFMLGNKHISFPVIATVLFGFLTMPEYFKKFIAAYKLGAHANSLKNWDWLGILGEHTKTLQQKIYAK